MDIQRDYTGRQTCPAEAYKVSSITPQTTPYIQIQGGLTAAAGGYKHFPLQEQMDPSRSILTRNFTYLRVKIDRSIR